ncbi:MAG: hypothetical protein KGP28_00400 [Bdellovibrionales bacterium]|nr:hypothetical protein [Bdellovibrionales bacterium]
MKAITGFFYIFPVFFLFLGSSVSCSIAHAQAGWYHVEKVSLEFHELIRVELQGTVVESSDPSLKATSIPFLQSLHYFGSLSRSERRYFPSISEIRTWILSDVCKETHEQTLKPMREVGNIGINPIKSKVKPISVTAIGTRIDSKGATYSETVFCPRHSAQP